MNHLLELPGWDLVQRGIADVESGRESVPAALVATAVARLSALGLVSTRTRQPGATTRLYELVAAEVGADRAHGRYNALRRRLVSFLRAAGATAR